MPDYKAPLRDIRFVRDELLGYEAHYQSPVSYTHLTLPTICSV